MKRKAGGPPRRKDVGDGVLRLGKRVQGEGGVLAAGDTCSDAVGVASTSDKVRPDSRYGRGDTGMGEGHRARKSSRIIAWDCAGLSCLSPTPPEAMLTT